MNAPLARLPANRRDPQQGRNRPRFSARSALQGGTVANGGRCSSIPTTGLRGSPFPDATVCG